MLVFLFAFITRCDCVESRRLTVKVVKNKIVKLKRVVTGWFQHAKLFNKALETVALAAVDANMASNRRSIIQISGRGFLGLPQSGLSAHSFLRAQCQFIRWTMFDRCGDWGPRQ